MFVSVLVPVVVLVVVVVWKIDMAAGAALLAGLVCIVCERDIGRAMLGAIVGAYLL